MTLEILEAQIAGHNQALKQDFSTLRAKTHPKVIKDHLNELLGPAALIKGVIHMLKSNSSSTRVQASSLKEGIASAATSTKEVIKEVSENMKDRAVFAGENAKNALQSASNKSAELLEDTANTAAQVAKESLASAANSLKDQAGQVTEGVKAVGQKASQQLKDGTRQVKASVTDNPWVTGLIISGAALTVAGIAVAMSSSQRKEQQLDMRYELSRFDDDGNPHTDLPQDLPEQKSSHVSSARIQTSISNLLQQRPLLVGSAALLLGAGVGILLPRSSYEDKMMGESSNHLIESVKGTVSETLQEVKTSVNQQVDELKQVATETGEKAKQTLLDSLSS